MDNKYGCLFSSKDMLTFARLVSESGVDPYDDNVMDLMLEHYEGRFPKDEPLFLLRGKDNRALACVRNYRTMISYSGRETPDPALVAGVHAVVTQFEDFARNHPDRMKDPD